MYRSFYDLTQKAFPEQTEHSELWFNKERREGLEAFRQAILAKGGGVFVLTGPVGSGKTSFLRKLVSLLPHYYCVREIVHSRLPTGDILHLLAKQFGIDAGVETTGELLRALDNTVRAVKKKGEMPLLVIDEAQNLNQSVLYFLKNIVDLNEKGEPLALVLLAGQPGLASNLQRVENRELRDKVVFSHDLELLDENESREYIHFHLKRAGGRPEIFSDDALHEIFVYSKGAPRLINIVCDVVLLQGFKKRITVITKKAVLDALSYLKLPGEEECAAHLSKPKEEENQQQETEALERAHSNISKPIFWFVAGVSCLLVLLFLLPMDTAKKESSAPPLVEQKSKKTVLKPSGKIVVEQSHSEISVESSISPDRPSDKPEVTAADAFTADPIVSGKNTYFVVNVSFANVRDKPSNEGRVLTIVTQGTLVKNIRQSRRWHFVELDDRRRGWIFESLLKQYGSGEEARRDKEMQEGQMAVSGAIPTGKDVVPISPQKKISKKLFPANLNKTNNPLAMQWAIKSAQSVKAGRYNQSIEEATQAITMDPGLVDPYVSRARVYAETGRRDEAERDSVIALFNRGKEYQRQGKTEKARLDLQKACDNGLEAACTTLDHAKMVVQDRSISAVGVGTQADGLPEEKRQFVPSTPHVKEVRENALELKKKELKRQAVQDRLHRARRTLGENDLAMTKQLVAEILQLEAGNEEALELQSAVYQREEDARIVQEKREIQDRLVTAYKVFEKKDLAGTRKLIDEIVHRDPKNEKAIELQKALLKRETEARQAAQKRRDIQQRIARARRSFKGGDLTGARQLLHEVLRQEEEDAAALDLLNSVQEREKELEKAKLLAEKSFESVSHGRFEETIVLAGQALSYNPSLKNARINRAWAYAEMKQFTLALADCDAVLAEEPENALALNNKGYVYQLKKEFDDAANYYAKACDLKLQKACENLKAVRR